METSVNTELRKAPPIGLQRVARVLDELESWKKFMAHIPENLNDIENPHFKPKYNTHHITLIETAGAVDKRSCAEILFEEWGISGKIRPTLGNLLDVLKKAVLYKAADVVSEEFFNGIPVQRPASGPEAPVDISLTKLLGKDKSNNNSIEKILNNMKDLSTIHIHQTLDSNINNNQNYEVIKENKNKFLDPHINLSSNAVSLSTEQTILPSSASDMIIFSSEIADSTDVPQFDILLCGSDNNENSSNNVISENKESSAEANHIYNSRDKSDSDLTNSSLYNTKNDIPYYSKSLNLSNIMSHSLINHEEITDEYNIPNISKLQNGIESGTDYGFPSDLTHIEYKHIENTTNNFDDRPYVKDDYNSGRKLGFGGTGTVYLANGLFGFPVAVKRLSTQTGTGGFPEDILVKQFKKEVEFLSKCKHENLLLLLGYSCDGPNNCVIYEYMINGSLQDHLAINIDFDSSTRMKIALGSAKGIAYLHYGLERTLIHRDIKSANILLTKSRNPKLCDFGLVKDTLDHTITSRIIGTSAYMSPEAHRGDVSVQMDVFSFGVVLLELLTGLPPLDRNRPGKDILTYVQSHCADNRIEPLLDVKAGEWNCAEDFYKLALECLNINKLKRPKITDVAKIIEELYLQ